MVTASPVADRVPHRCVRPTPQSATNQTHPTRQLRSAASHFRFPDPLQQAGSGSGKPINLRDRQAIKLRDAAHARERSSKEVRETVLHDDGATVPLTIPRQKGETDLAVKEVKVEGRRYIVCRNEEEARKDAETRAALLAGLQRKLSGGAKSLVGNKGYRRFLAAPGDDGFAIDPAKVEADAQFDGVFVLRTSLSMSALAVVLRYRNLLTVEQSFLAAKALLATRPVFHRTDAAIRGHVFCTFLALVLRKELLDRLAARG